MTLSLSLIIVCYKDRELLFSCLKSLALERPHQVIVVDATPNDLSASELNLYPWVEWVRCAPGRAKQLNQGAASATGDFLLFLHSDSILLPGWSNQITQPLLQPEVGLSAFRFQIASTGWAGRALEYMVWIRSSLFKLPYGDQGFCIRRSLFLELAGFPEQEFMEDYEFIRQVKRKGKVTTISQGLLTSARRWDTYGYLLPTLINQFIVILYRLGVAPTKLKQIYKSAWLQTFLDKKNKKR